VRLPNCGAAMVDTPELCAGNNCRHRKACGLYSADAKRTHGYMDMDEGWTCPEWVKRAEPAETRDDLGELGLF
jgi:hypothetical protein